MDWDALQTLLDAGTARLITADATVEEVEPNEEETQLAEAAFQVADASRKKVAAPSPLDSSGKPRMLKITAWIAHAGKPNRNGDAFREEDLRQVVAEGLFSPPYMGMVDFNHDLEAYGAWYKASFAYDESADAYGILAEGAVFAWAYNELSEKMLAEQQRNGSIKVSMACMFEDVEVQEDEEGRRYHVIIEPTFFTASLLDIPPADKDADGRVSEDANTTTDDLADDILNVGSDIELEHTWRLTPEMILSSESERNFAEDLNMDELIEALRDALGDIAEEQSDKLADVVEAAQKLPTVEADLEDALEEAEDLRESMETLKADKEDAEVALEAAQTELAEAQAELVELTEFKAEIEEQREAERLAALREERLAQLPDAVLSVLENKDDEEKEAIIATWLDRSEEEWENFVALVSAGRPEDAEDDDDDEESPEGRYARRTAEEGPLSTMTRTDRSGEFEIDKYDV